MDFFVDWIQNIFQPKVKHAFETKCSTLKKERETKKEIKKKDGHVDSYRGLTVTPFVDSDDTHGASVTERLSNRRSSNVHED